MSACYVKAVFVGEDSPAVPVVTPEDSRAYWFQHIATSVFYDPSKELLAVIIVNAKLRTIGWNCVSIGSLNEAIAHPREILRPVIAAAGYGFIMMHHHPSGDSAPSDADKRLTKRIYDGAQLLDIRLIDHVIVGTTPEHAWFSFRERGML